MKLGMSLYTYGADLHAGRITVEEAIRHAASLGCQGIELIGDQHFSTFPYAYTEALHLRELTRSLGMEIACYSTYLHSMLRQDRTATFDEFMQMAENAIALTAALGCPVLRPTFASDDVQELVNLVTACLPTLEKYGVIWGVELHAPCHPLYYKEALDRVNSPWFRLIPDFSCWSVGGLPDRYLDAGMDTFRALAPYMVHCHGKAHRFDARGEEPNTPYRELLGILKETGFSGYVVCEYEGWIQEAAPFSSKEMAARHFALLQRYGR